MPSVLADTSDTMLLDWLASHGHLVRIGLDRYGGEAWTWRVSALMWAPAFSLRTAIAAAMEAYDTRAE